MNKQKIALMLVLLLMVSSMTQAKEIRITKFERNYTSLIGKVNEVRDNTGKACAVLCFSITDFGFMIQPNAGVLKADTLVGEIRLWIPVSTKRLTVRHWGMHALSNFKIPVELEQMAVYNVRIETDEQLSANTFDNSDDWPQAIFEWPSSDDDWPQAEIIWPKKHPFYMKLGYSILPTSGPTVSLGLNLKNHDIEIGATYGLQKTDNLFFYDEGNSLLAAYSYKMLSIKLCYGYRIALSRFFSVVPKAGANYNIGLGSNVSGFNNSGSQYQLAYSASATVGVTALIKLNTHFALYLTPEYNISITRSRNSEWIANYDSKYKGWTEGLGLSAGIMISF